MVPHSSTITETIKRWCIITGIPHLPYNPSADEPCTAVLARTDPNEQESVVLLD